MCVPETPSSCDFKLILFSPHLKSFTLTGRHFVAFKNKGKVWGGVEAKDSEAQWNEENGGTPGELSEGSFLAWSYGPCDGIHHPRFFTCTQLSIFASRSKLYILLVTAAWLRGRYVCGAGWGAMHLYLSSDRCGSKEGFLLFSVQMLCCAISSCGCVLFSSGCCSTTSYIWESARHEKPSWFPHQALR